MTLHPLFKSIIAIIAGILVGAILSVATDAILENTGVFPSFADQQANGSPTWVLVVATVYRTIYTILSGYVGAKLAPSHPMRHATILGVIALLANLGGGIAMWKLGQHWYPMLLTVLALPSTWLGGKLYLHQKAKPAVM
jgi:hypothetical protein